MTQMLEKGVECSRWAQDVCDAILTAAKAEVGIARLQYSVKESMRPGTETLDRVEIIVSVKAPAVLAVNTTST